MRIFFITVAIAIWALITGVAIAYINKYKND